MEGRGDGRRSGYRIPLDLGRGEPNLRLRRFCISLRSEEISFIIEAAPRQPPNDNEEEANLEDIDEDVNIEDDEDAVGEESDSEHDIGAAQNEDGDIDLILEDNERYRFVNSRDQYAWIRFIWQVWPFSCGNIFEEIIFEIHGLPEEDLIICDYDVTQEHVADNDDIVNDGNLQDGDDHHAEDAANENELLVSANQILEQVDEHPLPTMPNMPNVRSKVEEIDEEAFRWWHEFDYNFSESAGIDVDEDDPPPTGSEKKKQEAKTDKKSGSHDIGTLVEEEEASEESDFVSCFAEVEVEAEPSPGPSRKRSREEAGLNQEPRRNKRFCRRSECDAKTSDGGAEDTLVGGATKRS
nr:uncharacterized protein LOC125991301 [Syngnathus scovelli]